MSTVSRITITSLISTLAAACQITTGPRWDIIDCWTGTIARELDSYTHLGLDDAALAALKTLSDTCVEAPWGQQLGEHGRVFVRRWGGWPQDDSTSVQVCVDGLPVVTIRYGWSMEAQQTAIEAGLDEPEFARACRTILAVTMHDRAAERLIRKQARAEGKASNEAYEQRLDVAAEAIRTGIMPTGWQIWEGQKGGRLVDAEGRYIGIAGALRRAGISSGDDACATLRDELTLAATLRNAAREHRLDARTRRLPACDRRRAA